MPEASPKKSQSILKSIFGQFQILLVGSYLLIPINIFFYYGFQMEMHHPTESRINPFGLEIWQIWAFHLIVGLLAGIALNPKRYLLSGFCGMLAAALVTGISLAYFGWRENIEMLEILIPLIFGILPAVKLYDFINRRRPAKS